MNVGVGLAISGLLYSVIAVQSVLAQVRSEDPVLCASQLRRVTLAIGTNVIRNALTH